MSAPLYISPPTPKIDEQESHFPFPKFDFNHSPSDMLEPFQQHISSLYSALPQFDYPVISFKESNENQWGSIAKEVLTPFAPQYPIYDYEKFIPEKHKKYIGGLQFLTTVRTEHSDTPLFPPQKRANISPFGIMLPNNKKSHHKVSFKDLPLENHLNLKKNKSLERLSNQPFINFQHFTIGSRAEILQFDDGRTSPFIKEFLIRKQTPNNNGLVTVNAAVKRKASLGDKKPARPQSSVDVFRRRQTTKEEPVVNLDDEEEAIGNSREGSVDSLLQDLKKLDSVKKGQSYIDFIKLSSKNDKQRGSKFFGTIKLLHNTLKAGTPKSRLNTPRSSMKVPAMVTPRSSRLAGQTTPRSRQGTAGSRAGTPKSRNGNEKSYGRFSNLYEERSKEYSLLHDLKYSGILKRQHTVDDEKKVKDQLRRHIRRKSDVSKYSGGECLKLAKNWDIVLASDFIKKSVVHFGGSHLLQFPNLKRKNLSNIKTKESSHNGLLGEGYSTENHVFKGAEGEVKSVVFDLPSGAYISETNSPQTKSSNRSPNRQHQLLRSDSLYRKTLQSKIRIPIGSEPILSGKSPHSGTSQRSSRPKSRETPPIVANNGREVKKDEIEQLPVNKKISGGDINQGLKTVLSLTQGAKKVLFADPEKRSQTPSLNNRVHKVKDLIQNENRQVMKSLAVKETITLRDISPYLGAQSFRGNDSKVTKIFSQDSARSTTSKFNLKKTENVKIKVFQRRHHSLPKVVGIETLQK